MEFRPTSGFQLRENLRICVDKGRSNSIRDPARERLDFQRRMRSLSTIGTLRSPTALHAISHCCSENRMPCRVSAATGRLRSAKSEGSRGRWENSPAPLARNAAIPARIAETIGAGLLVGAPD